MKYGIVILYGKMGKMDWPDMALDIGFSGFFLAIGDVPVERSVDYSSARPLDKNPPSYLADADEFNI